MWAIYGLFRAYPVESSIHVNINLSCNKTVLLTAMFCAIVKHSGCFYRLPASPSLLHGSGETLHKSIWLVIKNSFFYASSVCSVLYTFFDCLMLFRYSFRVTILTQVRSVWMKRMVV